MCKKNEIKCDHYCLDINESALILTGNLLKTYNYEAKILNSCLFEKMPNDVKFDLIFFNPVKIKFELALRNN